MKKPKPYSRAITILKDEANGLSAPIQFQKSNIINYMEKMHDCLKLMDHLQKRQMDLLFAIEKLKKEVAT